MLGGGISTYHPPDCSVTPSRLAPHTHSNSRPSRLFPFEDGALDYTVVPAGFPEAISLGVHVGSWSNSQYLGERSPCQAVQPVKERPHLSFTHALELASFFCTQALHGRVSSITVSPILHCSIPPRPDSFVLPARADHLAVGRPVDGIDLTLRKHTLVNPWLKGAHGTGDPGVAYLVFVARQVHCEVAVPCVPHFQGAVLAAGDEQSAVGRPGALVYLGWRSGGC
jgi:hypothetical protein